MANKLSNGPPGGTSRDDPLEIQPEVSPKKESAADSGVYMCPQCDYVTDQENKLSEHMKNTMLHGSVASEETQPRGEHAKPHFTIAQLIYQAIMSGKNTGVSLCDIYSFISEEYPFYKMKNKGWQNSIRHTLSLTKGFIKSQDSNKGRRGCNWRIRDGFKYEDLKSFHGGKSISLRELINKKSLGSQQAMESGKRCDDLH